MLRRPSSAGRPRPLLVLLAAILAIAAAQPAAHALCAAQEEDAQWINADPATQGITRAHLRFVCQDQILNGEPYPPGPPWYVHLWGKCVPDDCDWGEVGARRLGSGHVYAHYDQGFAKRYVYARMSAYRPGQLWVYIWTDFTDPSRPDYGMHQWFRRE